MPAVRIHLKCMLWRWGSAGNIYVVIPAKAGISSARRPDPGFCRGDLYRDSKDTHEKNAKIHEAFGFDDVLLLPNETNVKPAQVSTKTRLTKTIELGIPLISAGHDNVTESPMAIALAHLGGLGIIHNNMPPGKQVEEVRRVKRAEAHMVLNPITVSPDTSVAEAVDLMTNYKISGIPVVDPGHAEGYRHHHAP